MQAFLVVVVVLGVLVSAAAWYMTAMPGQRHRGLPPPLGSGDLNVMADLKTHVGAVASEEHNVQHPLALERAARYIETTLAGFGYAVARQEFEAGGVKVRNLEVVRPGSGAGQARLVVIGAHYDSAPGAVGANDNGSGVAALLELARALRVAPAGERLEVRLVFYVNEELPWSRTDKMGSYVHAAGLAKDRREVTAMLSLETIGWFSSAAGSQRYPFPFSLFYPATGDFIGFVSNLDSRTLLRRVIGSFRRHSTFPSEGVAGPASMRALGRSDHWSYWKFGWPAIMVTDTAPYRYPHYHTLRDTPDKLDYDRLTRVVRGLEGVVRDLATASGN